MAVVRANRTKSDYRRAFRPYGLAIGDVVYTWNSLHDELAKLFELTINSKNRSIGASIWYSTDSDYAQRKMLKAALGKASHFTPKQRSDISWMLSKVEENRAWPDKPKLPHAHRKSRRKAATRQSTAK